MSSSGKPESDTSDNEVLALLKTIRAEQDKQKVLLEKVVLRIDALETRVGLVQGQPKPSSPKSFPNATGLSGGGGGGSSSSSSSSSGSSSRSGGSGPAAARTPPSGSSSPKHPPLCAAFKASTFPAIVFPTGKFSSRTLSAELQSTLFVHRLSTALREDECAREPLDHWQWTVLPDPAKGFSHFVVASLDPAVLAEAHAVRGAVTKSCGCVALPLASLPPELELTLDRVLHYSTDDKPIVLHATLSPRAPMPYTAFVAAYRAWGNFVVCDFRAAGEVHESKSEEEGEAEPMGRLSIFSELSAPYALVKLNKYAVKVAQNAGGSPGTG